VAVQLPIGLPTRSRVIAGLVMLLALAGLTVFAISSVSPPAPVGADAPAGEFSATRAYAHVEQIGSQVHPVGSAGATQVRDHIVSALTDIGLQPEVRDGVGFSGALSGPPGMAAVHNVVAVVPGSAPTGRVVLFAHYDSVQVSYGGNDDGAGVSTLLETARAVMAGPRPANDLVFLFTDGEEACLCGAESFVSQDPLAADGGVALNFESRGSTGPAVMFETNRGNTDVVGMYGSAVPYPVATSFAVEVYRLLPSDTDFTPFRESGIFTGLNTAYIDGSAVYHTPQDKPSYMDLSSLQHHGSNALALARAFGNADIAALQQPTSGDSTYFPALGGLVRYPGWLVWPLAILAMLAVGTLAVLIRRRGLAGWSRMAAGVGVGVIPLVLAPVVAQLLWTVLVALRPGYVNMIDPWWPGWFRATVVALVCVVVLTWYGLLRRPVGPWALLIGALAWLGLLGVVLAVVAPGGSYLASLPALATAIAGIVAVTVPSPWAGLIAALLGGAVAVVILAPTVYMFFPALGLATGAAGALFSAMLVLALLPVIELLYPELRARQQSPDPQSEQQPAQQVSRHRLRSAAPALVAGIAAVVFLATGLAVDHFDEAHPAPAELAYLMDTDSGLAHWVSTDQHPGEWLDQYVTDSDPAADAGGGLFGDDVRTGPAPVADLPAPTVTVVSDTTVPAGGDLPERRRLTLQLDSERAARLIYLELPDADVVSATVDGRDMPPDELTGPFGLVFHAPPAEGLRVELELRTTGPISVRVMDGTDGLDGLPGFNPRPAGIGVQGSHISELVVVAKSFTV